MSDKLTYSNTKVPTVVTSYDDGFSGTPIEDVIDVDSVEVPTPEANIPEAAKAVEVEATALGDAAVPAGAETCALTTPDLSTAAPILSI